MAASKCGWVCVGWCALTAMAGVWATPSQAAIQYDVTVLSQGTIAYGVDHGRAVGESGGEIATLWNTPSQPTILGYGYAYGIAGNQVVGYRNEGGGVVHAYLWPQQIDLDPEGMYGSIAYATDGTVICGVAAEGQGGIWQGRTFIPISGGVPTSIADGVLVGGGSNGPALLWQDFKSTPIDLRPPVAVVAAALGVSHGQVVGWVILPNTTQYRAALWTQETATSFVDLNPPLASSSQLKGTNGTQQVGYYTIQ